MTVLPSPIPHPLDLLPWDLPGWAYEGLEWVIGVEWPEGNEKAVWDLADAWFAVASAMVGPRDDAYVAASEVLSGYGATGMVGRAFDEAWRRLADGDEAPLILLLTVSHELGKLVEECGCDIEGAKIEVWIEVGILVVELIALAVAVILTLGAASPAAAAAMTASRFVIQQIFRKLIAALAKKTVKNAVKEAAERAVKQTSRAGLKQFAKKAGREGLEEMGEEVGVDLGTQVYQNTTGRRDGLDIRSLGMSALGGFAGGAGASLAGLGRHATSRGGRFGEGLVREVGGEMLGETAASLATGNGMPDLDEAARAATSGARSGLTSQSTHLLNTGRLDALSGTAGNLSVPPTLPSLPTSDGGPSGASPSGGGGSVSGSPAAPGGGPSVASSGPEVTVDGPVVPVQGGPVADTTTSPAPAVNLAGTGVTADTAVSAQPSTTPATNPAVTANPQPSVAPGPVTQAAGAPPVSTTPQVAATPAATGPVAAASASTSAVSASVPVSSTPTTSTPVTSTPTTPTTSTIHSGQTSNGLAIDLPTVLANGDPAPAPRPPADPTPELERRERAGYANYARTERELHEEYRRDLAVEELAREARERRDEASTYAANALVCQRHGQTGWAAQWSALSHEAEQRSFVLSDRIDAVREGRELPSIVGTSDTFWQRINDDVGTLAPGDVESGATSALTGSGQPPSVDSTRPYGRRGGLRMPLALHQRDLERAMPRDPKGRVLRTPDVRRGSWFRLSNDGGPVADPTRSINCLDCVLSFYETWVHGRPRVSAPRTFDSYAEGDPYRPLYGEDDGPSRAEDLTGGRFQALAGYPPPGTPAATTRQAVDAGFATLHQRLLDGGHGSMAFLVTGWEGGSSHAWAAVNQNGTIVYVDPQSGRYSENRPLYGHSGQPYRGSVVAVDALVLGPDAQPMPIDGADRGTWTGHPGEAIDPRSAESRALAALDPAHRDALVSAVTVAAPVAAAVQADLAASIGDGAVLVDTEHRVKTAGALARTFREAHELDGTSPEAFLAETADLVRFSVQTPETGYGDAVRSTLSSLEARGYAVEDVKNFWRPGNRHNGLNVTLRSPGGQLVEVQFPTELSRALGKRTHTLYEIVRLPDATPAERVAAFLDIMALNQEMGIEGRRPDGLDHLPPPKNTSFEAWTRRFPATWQAYLDGLASQGRTFADVVAERGLSPEGLGLSELQLPRALPDRGGPAERPDRDAGLDGPAGSRGVERAEGDLDVRPGTGGTPDLRRPVRGPDPPGGPPGGGTDRPGPAGHDPAGRDGAPADVRGTPHELSDPPVEALLALREAGEVSPLDVRFTSRSVAPDAGAAFPIHGVIWGDGSLATVDDAGLRRARVDGLDRVPFVVHAPSDPDEGGRPLAVEIRELPDGRWTVGGDEGRVVRPVGSVPATWGEHAMYRAAEQTSLLPAPLFGTDLPPVTLQPPPDTARPVRLTAREGQALTELRQTASDIADVVEADLAAAAAAVGADLVGTDQRLKSADSLARKLADAKRTGEATAEDFVATVNDVLRFSVLMPDGPAFRPALERLLETLVDSDYTLVEDGRKNFWRLGNRFFGVNCSIREPGGQVFELQLPTELSMSAGLLTHDAYEVLRRDDVSARRVLAPLRVHAHLRMLAVNKGFDLAGHAPPDIDAWGEAKDATFANWIVRNGATWRHYKAWMGRNGLTFADVVEEFGLDASDFPVADRLVTKLGVENVQLLRALPEQGENDPVRHLRDGPPAGARDALGPRGEGLDVRPGARGEVLRRSRRGPVPGGGPGDGGADHAGRHRRRGAPGRGDDRLDIPLGGPPPAGLVDDLLPQDDSGYRLTRRDLDFLGITPEQVVDWADRTAPLGQTPAQFREFTRTLFAALRADGLDPAEVDVRLQGSSARFFSGAHKSLPNRWYDDGPDRPLRRPFDSMYRLGLEEPSDYDVQISSDTMVAIARRIADREVPDLSLHHPKYGFVRKEIAERAFPHLLAWAEGQTALLGRDVVPALFTGAGPPDRSDTGVSSHFADSDWIIEP